MNKITAENEEAVKRVLDDIFDNFDFERVKKTMDALDWQWCDVKRLDPKDDFKEKTVSAVPTLDEIKEVAAKLMWECANMDTERLATGGLVVEKDFTDPNDPWMRLSFEVTDWDAAASELDEDEDNDEDDWVQVFRDANGKVIE